MNSTHLAEVVRVYPKRHPNADALEIVEVWDYTCCVRKGDFKAGDLAVYIPPDSVVPETEIFAFLGDHRRIRIKRLRGIISMGLLVPAPSGNCEGDDVAELLGITHYEPVLPLSSGGETEEPPPGFHPSFDVDSFYRYAYVLENSEPVFITEKIHGASARYCWHNLRMYCGSKSEWKKADEKNLWWKALAAHPEIRDFCIEYPDITVYGEVYGDVQNLKYGADKGQVNVAVFDLLHGNEWISPLESRAIGRGLPWVPTVAKAIPFDKDHILKFAEGPSLIPRANHIREGIVVKPMQERTCPEIGRICLKIVSSKYLEKG